MFLKVSEVRKRFHANGVSVKPEAIETLNRQIGYLVDIACSRCKEDRRKRADSKDVIIQAVIDIKNKRGI